MRRQVPPRTVRAMRTFSSTAVSGAPPERVWELLADVTSWPRWSRFERTAVEARGKALPEGVGAIRRLHADGLVSREQVIALEPATRLALAGLDGLPVRTYRTEVTLTRLGTGGTRIDWTTRFRARRPWRAAAAERVLRQRVGTLADALALAAETWEPGLGATRRPGLRAA